MGYLHPQPPFLSLTAVIVLGHTASRPHPNSLCQTAFKDCTLSPILHSLSIFPNTSVTLLPFFPLCKTLWNWQYLRVLLDCALEKIMDQGLKETRGCAWIYLRKNEEEQYSLIDANGDPWRPGIFRWHVLYSLLINVLKRDAGISFFHPIPSLSLSLSVTEVPTQEI